jgi:hypothetical protein
MKKIIIICVNQRLRINKLISKGEPKLVHQRNLAKKNQ